MIPTIIHQTYINETSLPSLFRQCQQQVRNLHPDWTYMFHSDAEIEEFMRSRFPEYKAVFDALPRKIMKIDMIRYFWMYEYGGVYADMDYYMVKPFDLLNHDIVLPVNRENMYGVPTCLGNCIFASIPKHPFWKTIIDTLFTIDRTKVLDFSVDSNVDGHMWGTGPAFVYHMWKQWVSKEGIYVPKRSLFHPPTQQTDSYIRLLKEKGEAYGVHKCSGVWRTQ